MRLTLLGTGTPAPNPRRAPAAVAIEIGEEILLVDAGGGCTRAMGAAKLDPGRVARVLLTHHHLDHVGGLYEVVLLSAFLGRTAALPIEGPPGTEALVAGMLEGMYAADVGSRFAEARAMRRCGLDPGYDPEAITRVAARDLEPGPVAETETLRVVAGAVQHGAPDPLLDWRCYGYRIECGGRVVAISGDTVPCPGVVALARGADLLVQCCHFPESRRDDPAVRELARHTLPTAAQAGAIAAEAGVARLVLTHLSAGIQGPEAEAAVIDAVAQRYAGSIVLGADLMTFEV